MRREWRIWLGFMRRGARSPSCSSWAATTTRTTRSQLSAGTSLPTHDGRPVHHGDHRAADHDLVVLVVQHLDPVDRPAHHPAGDARHHRRTPSPRRPPPTAAPTTPPTTEPPLRIQFGPGTYRIGIDLPAGTYRTDGGPYCFWARLSSLSGTARLGHRRRATPTAPRPPSPSPRPTTPSHGGLRRSGCRCSRATRLGLGVRPCDSAPASGS